MFVYVLNQKGEPLMPCKPAIARLLLKEGKAIELYKTIKNKSEVSRILGMSQATINRMLQTDYKPYLTNAKYTEDYERDYEWFNRI